MPSASWSLKISSLIALLVLLLALDLLVTATRTGILNARHARLASLSEEHGNKAGRTLDLLKRRPNLRDSLRLSLALLRFLMAGIVLDVLIPGTQSNASLITLGALLAIGLVIWLAEFFVERHILRDPESWALRLSSVAAFITAIMSPILYLPIRLVSRGDAAHQPVAITEDELKSFVDASERQGVLEQDERQMIFSIFKFGDTLVREIMVPRIDIYAIDIETSIEQATADLIESGYSRVPLYKESIDNIQGVLYVKDMLKVGRSSQYKSLRDLMRQPYPVPESKKLDELLAEMQGQRMHMAIVVDEYGGVAGLVTLEDLMEEIVGEIQDEYDLGEEQTHQKISEGEYVFHGRIPLADFNELMGSELSTENADTLGGFLFSHLGRIPKAGEQVTEDGLLLTIEQVTGRRIRRVRAQRNGKSPAAREKEAHVQ